LPNVLAPNGVVAIYGSGAPEASIPFQFLLQNSITLKFFLVYLMPPEQRARATAEITRLLERGELVHNVAQSFDLGAIVAAHEAVEAAKAMGTTGARTANRPRPLTEGARPRPGDETRQKHGVWGEPKWGCGGGRK